MSLILLIIAGALVYFVPTIIAFSRGHAYRWIIFIFNLLLPGVGWIIGLIWAIFPSEKSLADPVIGNTTGIGIRNAGDTLGEVKYGIERGYQGAGGSVATPPHTSDKNLGGSNPTEDIDPGDVDVASQLKKLSQLRGSGAITSEEFSALMNSVVTGNKSKKAVHAIHQLSELSVLLQQNALSDEEFRQTKAVLLREFAVAPSVLNGSDNEFGQPEDMSLCDFAGAPSPSDIEESELRLRTARRILLAGGTIVAVILSSLGFAYRMDITAFARNAISQLRTVPQKAPFSPGSNASIAAPASHNSSPKRSVAPKAVTAGDTSVPEKTSSPASAHFHRDIPSAADMILTKNGDRWRVTITATGLANDSLENGSACQIQAVGRLSEGHLIAHPVPSNGDVSQSSEDDVLDMESLDISAGDGGLVVVSSRTIPICGGNQDLTGSYLPAENVPAR